MTPTNGASPGTSVGGDDDHGAALQAMLRPVVVLSMASRNFGLERCAVHAGEQAAVGGFLCRRSNKRKWHSPHFYRLDAEGDALCAMNKSEIECRVPYAKIIAVDVFKSDDNVEQSPALSPASPSRAKPRSNSKEKMREDALYFLRVRHVHHGEVTNLDLRPIDASDLQQVLRWVAALQVRAKVYNPGLDADRAKALKAILWLQSLYRGSRARLVAQNLALKRQRPGFGQQVRSLFSRQNLSTSPDAPGGTGGGGDALEVAVLSDSNESSSDDDETAQVAPPVSPAQAGSGSLGRRFSLAKRPSTAEPVDDELWENERWATVAIRGQQMYRGWSSVALLPTERAGFSDRVGRGSWDSLEHMPVPAGWKISQPWTLDRSGLATGLCDAEGWAYNVTFFSLDSNWAAGRAHTTPSAQWLVRRRRWFRRRVPDPPFRDPLPTDEPGNVLVHGWIGMRGIATGRWVNHYALLPEPLAGDSVAEAKLGAPFSYFKTGVRVHDRQGLLCVPWEQLSGKHLKRKALDNMCKVADDIATYLRPGLFSLQLTGEAEPRLVNAFTQAAREKWVRALRGLIEKSPKPNYLAIADRRSMRKGAAWELARATGMLKGAVTKRAATPVAAALNESEVDLSVVAKMREEAREERTRACSSDGGNSDSGLSFSAPVFKRVGGDWRLRAMLPKSMTGFGKRASPAPPFAAAAAAVEAAGEAAGSRGHALHATVSEPTATPLAASALGLVFEPPSAFDNVLIDVVLPLDVDAFDHLFFHEEDFHRDLYAMQGVEDVETTPWTAGRQPGSEARRSLKQPRDGVVPPTRALHLFTYVQSVAGKGHVVDQVTNTPDVPFGSAFANELRYVYFNDGVAGCRLIISQRVTFRKASMAASMIKSSTRREVARFYKATWLPFFKRWLATNRAALLRGGGFVLEDAAVAAPPAGGDGAAEPVAADQAPWRVPAGVAVGLVVVIAVLLVCLARLAFALASIEQRLAVLEARLSL